ncbi:aminotransferase class V-fold PLP-dependent enzyme [Arcicella aquatica]|uniref:Aminotransferase class V-fold PLP-dependent enzyme n=1 Tax=Arcicella aquatica TaxID=217141 RepID=A0ABU5QSQ0_9BACT|nr:aminotransferase class V-fold PLP-dependent enzyme [Arcicella aquatica]MEA5260028.1 aminotransferase class V-fold PLP-dependent enzyme [Arcicella aquatica]
MKIETLAIQSTQMHDANAGAVISPIYLSTTFERETDGSYAHGYVYSRADNPNRQLLEKSMALLENGAVGLAFASGMAATTALFQSLKSGDHIITPDDAYYATNVLITEVFGQWGLSLTTVDMTDLSAVKAAIQPNTKLFWIETPSNPQLKITDIEAISKIAKEIGALVAVDNTWATPVLQQPINLGADIVMHSTTKYFGGHSDVLSGALIIKEEGELSNKLRTIQRLTGGVPSPFESWLVARGIKTLVLRVKAQTDNAKKLADFLSTHPQVEVVHYPGLASHPQHEIAKKQMLNGFGAMLSVQIKGDAQNAMAVTGKLKLFTTATSLGGVESLIEHRKSVEGIDSPTPENLLRVSVGLESIDDLIEDWKQALV